MLMLLTKLTRPSRKEDWGWKRYFRKVPLIG